MLLNDEFVTEVTETIIDLALRNQYDTKGKPVAFWSDGSIISIVFLKKSGDLVLWKADVFDEGFLVITPWESANEAGIIIFHNNLVPDVLGTEGDARKIQEDEIPNYAIKIMVGGQ